MFWDDGSLDGDDLDGDSADNSMSDADDDEQSDPNDLQSSLVNVPCVECSDAYQLLELPLGANSEEIKQAQRELAKSLHPDAWGQKRGVVFAEEHLKRINAACDHLARCAQSVATCSGSSSIGHKQHSSDAVRTHWNDFSSPKPQFTEKRRQLFERMISVSGVGPSAATRILRELSVEQVVRAVRSQDYTEFTRIPGIGKKFAERLVAGLMGKVDDFAIRSSLSRGMPNG